MAKATESIKEEKSVFSEALSIVGKYFGVRLLVSVIFSAVTWVVMGPLVLGIKGAIPVSIFVGLANLVPYVGPFVAMAVTAVVTGVQTIDELGGLDEMYILWMMLTLLGLQVLDAVVLSPLMLGRSLGLHPIVVFIAIMAGGSAFGIIGVIVATPVAAIVALILRRIRKKLHARRQTNAQEGGAG